MTRHFLTNSTKFDLLQREHASVTLWSRSCQTCAIKWAHVHWNARGWWKVMFGDVMLHDDWKTTNNDTTKTKSVHVPYLGTCPPEECEAYRTVASWNSWEKWRTNLREGVFCQSCKPLRPWSRTEIIWPDCFVPKQKPFCSGLKLWVLMISNFVHEMLRYKRRKQVEQSTYASPNAIQKWLLFGYGYMYSLFEEFRPNAIRKSNAFRLPCWNKSSNGCLKAAPKSSSCVEIHLLPEPTQHANVPSVAQVLHEACAKPFQTEPCLPFQNNALWKSSYATMSKNGVHCSDGQKQTCETHTCFRNTHII